MVYVWMRGHGRGTQKRYLCGHRVGTGDRGRTTADATDSALGMRDRAIHGHDTRRFGPVGQRLAAIRFLRVLRRAIASWASRTQGCSSASAVRHASATKA